MQSRNRGLSEARGQCRSGGVNRLSFGVQAMDDCYGWSDWAGFTRWDEAIQSYDLAREVGFDNINLDLIFALPNQTVEEWKSCLQEVISLQPEHISAYSLMLEEGTVFYESWRTGKLEAAFRMRSKPKCIALPLTR